MSDQWIKMCVRVCVVQSAFDTLAKVFNPPEVGVRQSLAEKSQFVGGTTIQLIGRGQETPIIEVEGPLLTDSHVGFKVGGCQDRHNVQILLTYKSNPYSGPPVLVWPPPPLSLVL